MKRLFKRIVISAFVLLLLTIAGTIIEYEITASRGRRILAEMHAQLDTTEPGWQLPDWNDLRNKSLPKDAENIAKIAIASLTKLPTGYDEYQTRIPPAQDRVPGHLPDPDDWKLDQDMSARCREAFAALAEILKHERGGLPLVFPEPFLFDVDLEQHGKLRKVSALAQLMAYVAAVEQKPDDAILACRVLAHLPRGIGDDPLILTQLVRNALAYVAARETEYMLGVCEPKKGLAELQAALEFELIQPRNHWAFTGERAVQDRFMDNVSTGKLNLGAVTDATGMMEELRMRYARKWLDQNRAQMLDLMTKIRDDMKQSGPDAAASAEKHLPPKSAELGLETMYVSMLTATLEGTTRAELRTRGLLSCTIAAIACERYRIDTGRWPNSLDEIPKSLRNVELTDPVAGGPLKFKRTADGITIYYVGRDGVDNGGQLRNDDQKGFDLGITLFDPARRRQPPLPREPAPPINGVIEIPTPP